MQFLASLLTRFQVSGSLILFLWFISGLFDPWGKDGVFYPPTRSYMVTWDRDGLSILEDLLGWVFERWVWAATSGDNIRSAGGHLLESIPYFGFGAYVSALPYLGLAFTFLALVGLAFTFLAYHMSVRSSCRCLTSQLETGGGLDPRDSDTANRTGRDKSGGEEDEGPKPGYESGGVIMECVPPKTGGGNGGEAGDVDGGVDSKAGGCHPILPAHGGC